MKYATIINNSANHLSNVIEDALDLSRLENNKFEIFPEIVDIRDLLDTVDSIMEF